MNALLILQVNDKFKPEVLQLNGQSVGVESWHMINDVLHGFVHDFAMDIPARCLLNISLCRWFSCGLCHGRGGFAEYGEEYKCGLCNGHGGNWSPL